MRISVTRVCSCSSARFCWLSALETVGVVRWQALVLLALAIGKVFLVDMSELSQGYRILSFLGLGVLLLGVSFVYQRDWLSLKARPASAEPARTSKLHETCALCFRAADCRRSRAEIRHFQYERPGCGGEDGQAVVPGNRSCHLSHAGGSFPTCGCFTMEMKRPTCCERLPCCGRTISHLSGQPWVQTITLFSTRPCRPARTVTFR